MSHAVDVTHRIRYSCLMTILEVGLDLTHGAVLFGFVRLLRLQHAHTRQRKRENSLQSARELSNKDEASVERTSTVS